MKTLVCLFIFVFEFVAFYRLMHRYSEDGELEEFLSRAPLEDVIRAQHHSVMALFALQFATMMRLT